jgi:hypothetical protein
MMEVVMVKLSKHVILVTALVTIIASTMSARMNQGDTSPAVSPFVQKSDGGLSDSVQLSARPEKELIKSGEPVVLKLNLMNAGRKSLFVYETSDESDYKLSVKDEKGESVPLTEYGERLLSSAEELRRIKVEMKPGEERQVSIRVSKIYRMAAGSTYFITAKRQFFRRNGRSAEVISNEVKLQVADESAP